MNINNSIPMRIVAIFTLFAFILTQAVPGYACLPSNTHGRQALRQVTVQNPETVEALASGMGHMGAPEYHQPSAAPVAGLCVTGDTMLPIVYDTMDDGRGTMDEGRWTKDDGRWRLKPIVKVKPGEYVLSLNEETQEVEPHRINALLDMGVKPVYRLTTASGRHVKTTANHPYLVRRRTMDKGRWTKVSELKAGDEIAVPREISGPVFSADCGQDTEKQTQRPKMSMSQIRQSLIFSFPRMNNYTRNKKHDAQRYKTYSQNYVQSFKEIASKTNSQDSLAQVSHNFSNKFSIRIINFYHRLKQLYHIFSGLSNPFVSISWADTMQPSNSSAASSDILWDRIASIEYIGYEHVWDIEVDGTHNFIANGIFAHNTYAGAAAPAVGEQANSSTALGTGAAAKAPNSKPALEPVSYALASAMGQAASVHGDSSKAIIQSVDNCILRLDTIIRHVQEEISVLQARSASALEVSEKIGLLIRFGKRLEKAKSARVKWQSIAIKDFPRAVKAELEEEGFGALSSNQKQALGILNRGLKGHRDINFDANRVFFVPDASWLYDYFFLQGEVGARYLMIREGKEECFLIAKKVATETPLEIVSDIVHEIAHERFAIANLYADEIPLFTVLNEALTEILAVRIMLIVFQNSPSIRRDIIKRYMFDRGPISFLRILSLRLKKGIDDKEALAWASYVARTRETRFLYSIIDNMGTEASSAVISFLTEGDSSALQRLFGPAWNILLDVAGNRHFAGTDEQSLEYRLAIYAMGQALQYPAQLGNKMRAAKDFIDVFLRLAESDSFKEIFNAIPYRSDLKPGREDVIYELTVLACEEAIEQTLREEFADESLMRDRLYEAAHRQVELWMKAGKNKKNAINIRLFGLVNHYEAMKQKMRYLSGFPEMLIFGSQRMIPSAKPGLSSAPRAMSLLVITSDTDVEKDIVRIKEERNLADNRLKCIFLPKMVELSKISEIKEDIAIFDAVRFYNISIDWGIAIWHNTKDMPNIIQGAANPKTKEIEDRDKLMEEIYEMV